MFALADAALRGETVEFVHRGRKLKVVPEAEPDVFDRITPMPELFDETTDFQEASRMLLAEMENEWEKEWTELENLH